MLPNPHIACHIYMTSEAPCLTTEHTMKTLQHGVLRSLLPFNILEHLDEPTERVA